MRIHSLKLKNYRQYRDATITFSLDPDRNFTVLQGENGAGKSNLLNAITWCLYGEERHLSRETEMQGLPMLNEAVYHELQAGDTASIEVELALGDDEVQYIIKRTAEAYRRLDGDYSIRPRDPVVMFRVHTDWRTSDQPTYTINVLLPAGISRFFFFDGEQLDDFFKRDSTSAVQTGIVRVSQIDLLEQAIRHLDKVQTDTRRQAKGISPEAEKIEKEIEDLERRLENKRATLNRLQQDKDGLQENLEAVRLRLRTSDVEEVRRLQEDRDRIERDIKDKENLLKSLRDQAMRGLRLLGPRIYAHDALQRAAELIAERVEHGDLPPKVRVPFFRDLLVEEECICGCALEEGSPARARVEARMQAVDDIDYEGALEGKYKLAPMLDEIPTLAARQNEFSREIWGIDEEMAAAKKSLKEISEKMEVLGGEINLEEVETLEQQHRQYENELEQINQQIGLERGQEMTLQKDLDKQNTLYQRDLEKQQRKDDLSARLRLCTDAHKVLAEIRTELLDEVRARIQQKTEAYFLDLIWKKGTYKQVEINEEYQFNVLNVRDMPSLGTLSAGERQVLALAFMAALGTVSGFDAPIVIDTPIGRISGEPRENIAESLPNYLADTQIILLMTDTEYTDDVQKRLRARVGKSYRLRFDESEAMTHVVPL